jgi:hypothetical protein
MLMTQRGERRTTVRIPLRASVYVLRGPEQDVIHATTQNISIRGFYCLSQHELAAGQNIECVVLLATPGVDGGGELRLFCKAQVVRIERTGNPESPFGIACHIEMYKVLDRPPSEEDSYVP